VIKEVYKHIFSTYGRVPAIQFAFISEAIRGFIGRIVTVIILASMVSAVASGDFDLAQRYVLIWVGITIVASSLAFFGEYIGIIAENRLYGELMLKYYKKLTSKDMSFFRNNSAGYLAAQFRQHIDSGLIMTRSIRGDVLRTTISLVFPIFVLAYSSWQVGLATFLLIVSQMLYVVWSSKKANPYRRETHELYRLVSGEVADDVTNIVAYKASGKENEAYSRVDDLRRREVMTFTKRRKIEIYLNYPRTLVTVVLVAIAFWLALESQSRIGDSVTLLVLTITYMFQVLRSLDGLPDLIYRMDDLATKLYPTLEVVSDSDETVADPDNPIAFTPKQGAISINSLDFSYFDGGSETVIFKDLNLEVAGGERVGIVGLSGAGKSTLASLIMRFDDLQTGSISIDGTDIRDVKQSELRQNIAYVPQEPLLFHRSVRDNIAYNDQKYTVTDVEKAAKAAYAHKFIQDLPNGYDTIVGERGVKLSGGQKQRIVVARAVLKKAPIILFDEATSALDSESEHIIQKALPEIIGKHTAIIIAHRLSTVANLDRIIVMHDGSIIEEGNHSQLLAKKGRYYSLWKRQTSEEI